MSGGGFHFDLGIQTAGYAWAAWGMKICLGKFAGDDGAIDELERRRILEGGWSARKVASGRSQVEKLSKGR